MKKLKIKILLLMKELIIAKKLQIIVLYILIKQKLDFVINIIFLKKENMKLNMFLKII